MTFTDAVSFIGTLIAIAATIGGLMVYMLKQNPTRKQVALVSVAIGIALACVIILAEGISHLFPQSSFAQSQKTTITLVTAAVHVPQTVAVHVPQAGAITEFPLPDSHSSAYEIAKGQDGNLWFTEDHGFGRISPGGTITEFPLQANDIPNDLIIGPDGNLWFTDNVTNSSNGAISKNKIGRISPSGTITEFPLPNANAGPAEIIPGPDGNLWFTADQMDSNGASINGEIGRITPSK